MKQPASVPQDRDIMVTIASKFPIASTAETTTKNRQPRRMTRVTRLSEEFGRI